MVVQVAGFGKVPWDTDIPFPFRDFKYGGRFCVVGASLKGDMCLVTSCEGGEGNIEIYPTEVITGLSEPVTHFWAN